MGKKNFFGGGTSCSQKIPLFRRLFIRMLFFEELSWDQESWKILTGLGQSCFPVSNNTKKSLCFSDQFPPPPPQFQVQYALDNNIEPADRSTFFQPPNERKGKGRGGGAGAGGETKK